MKNKKVFVTGASGFIGKRLADSLVERGYQVNALIRDPLKGEKLKEKGINIFLGDITYPETVKEAVKGCSIVFHCAAQMGGKLEKMYQTNVLGTSNVIQAASDNAVKRLVHIGSIASYAQPLPNIVNEDCSLTKEGGPYSITKAKGERKAFELGKKLGINISIIQPTLVYGPGSPTWTMRFFYKVKQENIVLINGGIGICNLVYVGDVVDALILAANNTEAIGQRFIISGPEILTWKEYIRHFCLMFNKPLPPMVSEERAKLSYALGKWYSKFTRKDIPYNPSDINLMKNRSIFSIKKARELLGYEPKFDLQKGMSLTKSWLLKEGYLAS